MPNVFILARQAEPTAWQALAAGFALALLLASLAGAWYAFARRDPLIHPLARAATLLAAMTNLAVVLHRCLLAQRVSCPIDDNFDSLLLFVIMLAGLLFYLGRRPIRRGPRPSLPTRPSAVDLVMLPMMIAMQIVAVLIYFGGFRQFNFAGAWRPIHLASLLGAMLPLAAAAAGGLMFLLLDRALRRKGSERVLGTLPSLERLDRLMRRSVAVGFVLLTVSIFSGVVIMWQDAGPPQLARHIKLLAAVLAWLIYLAVLGVRWAPRLRGRLTAALCVVGLVMVLAAYFAVHWQR